MFSLESLRASLASVFSLDRTTSAAVSVLCSDSLLLLYNMIDGGAGQAV